MRPLRIAVVDDEPPARRRLGRLLSSMSGVELIGEAGDGASAVALLDRLRPDLVLLDIQMPGFDGFEVLRRVTPPRPLVIFVTAFDAFALSAFAVHAVDYLLKPVSAARLHDALVHARERHQARATDREAVLARLLDEVAGPRHSIRTLPVRSSGRVDLVDVSRIDWIEAADNYAVIHAGRERHIVRETLARLDRELDPSEFARIHRSTIVRVDRIVRLDVALRGDYDVTLRNGVRLTMSRTHRERLERAIGRRF